MRELDGLSMRCAELLEYGGGGSGTGLGWHWDVGSTLTLVAMLNTSTQARAPLFPVLSPVLYRKLERTTHAFGGPQQASSHSYHTCTRLAGGRRAAALHQLLGVPRAAAARRCGGRSPLRPALRRRPYILFTHPLRPLLQVYRSRHRHRVTTVTAPRAVLAVEWWRGEQTSRPTRPGKAGKQLLEPAGTGSETGAVLPLARSDDALAIGNVGSNENAIDEL